VRRHALIGGISFTLAWLIVAIVLFPDTGPAPGVTVPSVIGLRFDEAERKLAESGLRAALGETQPSLTAPRRYVVAQTPAPGTAVGEKVVVTLDVSAGQVRARCRPSLASPATMPSPRCARQTSTSGRSSNGLGRGAWARCSRQPRTPDSRSRKERRWSSWSARALRSFACLTSWGANSSRFAQRSSSWAQDRPDGIRFDERLADWTGGVADADRRVGGDGEGFHHDPRFGRP
jgi:hypothetical protein